ncbi:(d)CMP kinase [Microaerobacter geothermalis]|uniref:(d)CMP kinase n=1 Tax=Microaerobacter geothermalis TaxID=674972 RepID=UPI001F28A561|nr:(d)CMP kinase [Microaerobacter geothermalis]MCF6093520.1 (d)CMP kinase [Microaerobacter geothermalis]
MNHHFLSIAIDGPAGAGKSTVAQILAQKLGYTYIDTGAMYRALTWKALREGISPHDEEGLVALLQDMAYSFPYRDQEQKIYVNGEDISEFIRDPEVTRHVSEVAKWPQVRRELVERQRELASKSNVVMDGRDIGSHVLPHANTKIFLTASIEERALRRYQDLLNKGYLADLEQIKDEIILRDKKDSEREHFPLKVASNAVILDTTGHSIEEVVSKIIKIHRTKIGGGE